MPPSANNQNHPPINSINPYDAALTGHEQQPNPGINDSSASMILNGLMSTIAVRREIHAKKTIESIDRKSAVYAHALGDRSHEASGTDITPKTLVEKIGTIAIANISHKYSHAKTNNAKTQRTYYSIDDRDYIATNPELAETLAAQGELGELIHQHMFGYSLPRPEAPSNPGISSASDLVNIKHRIHPREYPGLVNEKLHGHNHLPGSTRNSKRIGKTKESLSILGGEFETSTMRERKTKIGAVGVKLGESTYNYTSKKERKYARKIELRKNILVNGRVGNFRKKLARKAISKAGIRLSKIEFKNEKIRENKDFAAKKSDHIENVQNDMALYGPFTADRY